MVDEPQFWAPGTPLSGMAFVVSGLRDVVMQSRNRRLVRKRGVTDLRVVLI